MARSSAARRGFSLIEALCALAVLSIGVIGLASGLTTALRQSKESERVTRAALYAQGLIESLKADRSLTPGEEEGELPAALGAMRWRRTVEAIQPEGLHHVTARIVDAKSGVEITAIETLLFDPPSRFGAGSGGSSAPSASQKRERATP